jgi:2-octaprenyl-6-methoxyphenol hydroxylase
MATDLKTAIVAGAGPAGLAAACLLAQAGFSTTCMAPDRSDDPRTVALMAPSLRLLESIGAWTEDLRQHSAPLRQLHIRDDTGHLLSAPDLRFAASEANIEAFGWNIPLRELEPVLRTTAARFGVTFVNDAVKSAQFEDRSFAVQGENGITVEAAFAVAADGRNSTLRKAAGIRVSEWAYEQSALVTRFAHSRDHAGVSTEWHKRGGPFTTVPLPGKNSALVWMDKPDRIAELTKLDAKALAREIQLQSHGELGLVSEVAQARAFTMRGVTANCFAVNRVYLVGEAAHVFPPLGAQGLNMSLRDAGHMVDVVLAHADPGSDAAMQEYNTLRRPDVTPRQTTISLMNRSLLSEFLPPHLARAAGLAAVALAPPLRELVIREGLSPSLGLPFAMRG